MPKSQPVRQCVACRAKREKNELLRIVRTPENLLMPDVHQKQSGRGAYLCRKLSCVEKAQKIGALSRALKMPIPTELWPLLEAEVRDG